MQLIHDFWYWIYYSTSKGTTVDTWMYLHASLPFYKKAPDKILMGKDQYSQVNIINKIQRVLKT